MVELNDLIGVPFKNGGRDKSGYDCYGLAIEVYRRYGIELPDYTISAIDAARIDQEVATQKPFWVEVDRDHLIVPTMVVMRFNFGPLVNHTGVYIGNGLMIHTIQKRQVHVVSINDGYWSRRIAGFYVHPSQIKGEDK